MASKTVIASDQREWQVRRHIEWSAPAGGEEFEHDVDGGSGAVVLILSSLTLFWAVIVAWGLAMAVYVPWYYWILALIIVGFFPVRWYLRRPWRIVAETEGSYEEGLAAEHWVGRVRGMSRAREETRFVIRSLRTKGTPGYADSPLQPVN